MMMTLLSVAAIWSIAAIVPGPNFFIIAHTAVRHARLSALIVALGIVAGTAIWGLAGFYGVTLLFAMVPWTYLLLKVIGGGYLIYLGVMLLINSFQTIHRRSNAQKQHLVMKHSAAFRLGLLTNMANPKTAAFVTSLFATTMPQQPSNTIGLISIMIMVSISLLWYCSMACFFSSRQMSIALERGRQWIDRVAGAIFISFGAKLAVER